MRNILRRFLVVLCAALVVVAGLAQSSNATTEGLYGPSLVGNYLGPCLDLPSNDVGARVVVTTCHYTYSSQKWYRTNNVDWVYNVLNANYRCMDVGPGNVVVMSPCHYEDSYSSQKWYPQNRGELGTQLRNGATGTCLDFGASPGPVGLATCHSAYTSQWWQADWL